MISECHLQIITVTKTCSGKGNHQGSDLDTEGSCTKEKVKQKKVAAGVDSNDARQKYYYQADSFEFL